MTTAAPTSTHEEAVAHKESSVGIAATKIWPHVVEPDATAAANFLNLNPPQGAGEASLTNRADGTVDVYYFL
jgi:hypothetical protein